MATDRKRRFSFDRKHWVILFCLASLLSLALAYLFVYIPSNEKYLNERRFNAMQRIETNIEAKESNTYKLIESLTISLGDVAINPDSLKNFLKKSFSESQPLVFDHVISADSLMAMDSETVINEIPVNKMDAIHNDGNIQFTFIRKDSGRQIGLVMNYTVDRFFSPLLQGAGFDEFVVVLSGDIIYESFPSGLNGSNFDTLTHINKYLVGANSKKLSIANLDYQAFIQPFSLGKLNRDCFVLGLVKYEKYQTERTQLPAREALFILTAGILILILLPWLKLFNMGAKDRLTIMDGALSFVVAMLLVSIIFMAFATLAPRYQKLTISEGMEDIAKKIEKRSTAYIADMKVKLESLDRLACSDSSFQRNIARILDSSKIKSGTKYSTGKEKENDTLNWQQKQSIFRLTKSLSIYQVFWLGTEDGVEKFNWNAADYNGPPTNYSKRGYYRKQKKPVEDYSIEQVISWTTGLFRTIISCRSKIDTTRIVCLSFPLLPVSKPVLPGGYSFAITDIDGEVLYHSVDVRNLNENFPDETSDPALIRSAIRSHSAHHIETRYKGSETRLFIRPVSFDGFRYWVLVSYDKNFEAAKDTGAFTFTLVMLLVFFLIVFLQMLIVVWVSAKKSRLNVFRLETDWIWPRPSQHKVYQFAFIYHIYIFLLLIGFYYLANFLGYFYMLVIAVTNASIFINFLYALHYRYEKRITLIRYKKRNILTLVVISFIISFFAIWHLWEDTQQVFLFLLFQLISIGLAVYSYNRFNKRISDRNKEKADLAKMGRAPFINSYARMAISRLIISSGLPVLFFYQYAYNNQQAAQAHFKQLNYARKIFGNDSLQNNSATNMVNFYTDNYWIKDSIYTLTSLEKSPVKKPDKIAGELLNSLRIYHTSYTRDIDAAAKNALSDASFVFNPILGTLKRNASFSTDVQIPTGQIFRISSKKIGFKYPFLFDSISSALYWILLILSILALYPAIRRVIQQIFALDVPCETTTETLANKILNLSAGNKLNYLTGLPGSMKMGFLNAATSPEKRLVIDLFEIPDKNLVWSDSKMIIFNHFEYILYNKDACIKVLTLLEKILVSKEKPAIIIASTVHTDRAIQLIAKLFNDDKTHNPENVQDRFQVLLGHFNAIILPLKATDHGELDDWEKANQQKWMKEEFNVSPFIERLRLPLKETYFRKKEEKEEVQYSENRIIKFWQKGIYEIREWFDDSGAENGQKAIWSLQNISGIFYHHIWQSLSPDERYLVYDLAEEGLVNQTNKYHLSMLIQKGVVKRKEQFGQLELMNDSFRDFILISVNKAEALQIKDELKASGSWSELKTPIMLVVIGILVILIASQQEAFSTIIGYMTAIAALIPTLNALFSLVKPAAPAKT
jgi:hypothetical protein